MIILNANKRSLAFWGAGMLACLISCFLSISVSASLSGTYIVGNPESDFQSLTAAFQAAMSEGVSSPVIFRVKGGVYTEEPLVVGAIDGSDQYSIRVEPLEDADVDLQFSIHDEYHAGLIFSEAQNITFDGVAKRISIKLNEPPITDSFTIKLTSTATRNICLKNCIILSHSPENIFAGVILDEAENTQLVQNLIGFSYIGLAAGTQSRTLLAVENDFGGNGPNSQIHHVAIKIGGSDAVLMNNRIRNLQYHQTKTILIGIDLNGDKNTLVANNLISGLYNHTLHLNIDATYAIKIKESTGARFFHNSIFLQGNDGGVNSWCLFAEGASTSLTLKNNCFYNVKSGLKIDLGLEIRDNLSLDEDHNFINGVDGTAIGFQPDETTVLLGNPNFLSLTDLHIGDSSACQDIAVFIADFPEDFDGSPRDNPCDAGAYERSSSKPTPTPAPECETLTLDLEMPATFFAPGDVFSLNAQLCNPDCVSSDANLFVCLEAWGNYWFAPSFINSTEGIDYYPLTLDIGYKAYAIIEPLEWPDSSGEASGLHFFGVVTDPEMTNLFSNLAYWSFSYGNFL